MLLLFSFTHNYASQNETITTFIQEKIKPLPVEQKQFFANFVYFSCATAWTDAYVRNNLNILIQLAWITRQEALKYNETTDQMNNLKRVIINLEDAIKTQQYHLKAWQACTNLVDQLDQTDPLRESIELVRDNVTQQVTDWSLANKKGFNEKLAQGSKALQETSQMLELTHKAYTQFIISDALVLQPDVDDQITKIISCSQISASVGEYCHKAFTAITPITDQENNLQTISAHVFYAYYKELYPLIQTLEPEYRTLIFNEIGFISVQERTENLPEFEF